MAVDMATIKWVCYSQARIEVGGYMPRPRKFRRVEFLPAVTVFKPVGVPLRGLEEIVLSIEELEAIRLKDLEGLEQEECARRMQVSRPTFQRILVSAREKVATVLTRGLALKVEGGTYKLAPREHRCPRCQGEFEVSVGPGGDPAGTLLCPTCRDQQEFISQGRHGRRGHRHAHSRRSGVDKNDQEDNPVQD